MNRYSTIEEQKTDEGVRFITNAVYPDIPATADDTYVMTTVGDRYDTLAHQFYNDASLWWIIASANPESNADSLTINPGVQIRIPGNQQAVIAKYEELNKKR